VYIEVTLPPGWRILAPLLYAGRGLLGCAAS
jgi:hypothetical protein